MSRLFNYLCPNPQCPICAAVRPQPPFSGASGSSGIAQWLPSYTTTSPFAPGGLVTSSNYALSPPPFPQRGMPGFDGREDFDLAAGTVTGARWWGLPAPDITRDPLDADLDWPAGQLCGARDYWHPGLNSARCLQGFGHPVPEETCSCGQWAYWRETPYPLGAGLLPVLGVIEGSGRVLIGEKGFRCQRARIVALHLPPDRLLVNSYAGQGQFVWYDEAWPPRPQAPADPVRLDAWLAVISDRLARMHPEARVYERKETMLRCHPPDTAYLPPAPARSQCQGCTARMTAAEFVAHRCPCQP